MGKSRRDLELKRRKVVAMETGKCSRCAPHGGENARKAHQQASVRIDRLDDGEKTVYVEDPFVWPIESYVERLENCPRRCREGLLAGTICDGCQDALTELLGLLQSICPICGQNRAVKVLCEEHE